MRKFQFKAATLLNSQLPREPISEEISSLTEVRHSLLIRQVGEGRRIGDGKVNLLWGAGKIGAFIVGAAANGHHQIEGAFQELADVL